jgi:AraC-like DNA-binding protein
VSAPTAGIGEFISWNGGCLLIGRSVAAIPMHAHYALQIAFGDEAGIRFRTSDRDEWTGYGGAMIPSRQPHAMDATVVPHSAVMLLEPETREGRVLSELHLTGGIAEVPAAAKELFGSVFDAWASGDKDALRRSCWDLIRAMAGGAEPRVASDERILRAIAYINANLDKKLSLEEVAGAAFLSPSRFRHLFVEDTGMALRPYILWRRFLSVWELAMQGKSMSEAAHAAGFADAAHLSRTSKRLFGFPPSALTFVTRRQA